MLVAKSLFLEVGTEYETSQAVAMEGHNALNYDILTLAVSGTITVDLYVQVSDDLELWEDWNYPNTAAPIFSPTAAAQHFSGCGLSGSRGTPIQVTRRFARYKYKVSGTTGGSMILRARLVPTTVFK